ncbi:LPS export ABC transporter periplasmic protein LptC [Neisseria chenwenguii]|uniref:LPS export ABC transporter periplasmic protein LptC n=1 Tax=Neisseria chenwenguii TaxID=1853278 RepID=A0A220S268_9NEIS|nr:LPS export ABC transporter periplasmic protein LptC [Neisseria chenwenguii]ASK27466.1 LPS export ABC transporter periplasmic protein LptC [Neisseria chenwenguii]ROV56902.1 LPS export ABC transporter periplasmic protein LptC [Neisseria chenwenguii]
MKIRWRYGLAFPLILSVALGGLSAWLGRISEVDIEEVKLNPKEPQYKMNGIDGRRFDEQGRLKEHTTSARAWQLPEQKDVHFDAPKLLFYRDGSLLYQVVGKEAVYNTADKKVSFRQDVVLTKEAEADRPAGVLKTDFITVDTETRVAKTDSPVQFQYGESSGTADGLTYDHQKGFLNLPSRVKATIYDVKNL